MDYIKFKNVEIPVRFSYRTIKNIKDNHNVDLVDQEQAVEWLKDSSKHELLFFELIRTGYKDEGKDNPYTINDMVDILSEPHVYADFLKIYSKNAMEFMTPSNSDKKKENKKES